jgi:FixJ family two-component response regulator/signal transduction histidine kinase
MLSMRVNRFIPEESVPHKTLVSPSSVDEQPCLNVASLCSEQVLAASALPHLRALNQKSIQESLCQIAAPILFLDSNLNIVFFTPAMKALFNILPSDLGRPLADLCSKVTTIHLLTEVQQTLQSGALRKTVIMLSNGRSFDCVIEHCSPWQDGQNALVLVFTETTEVRRLSRALTRAHEQASLQYATSAEHWSCIDQKFRQSAQSVALIAGQLAATEHDPVFYTEGLVKQLGENLEILFGRLSTELDLHHTEGGISQHDALDFSIQDILTALAEDCLPLAVTQHIKARIVPCSLQVKSHPDGLRQILSNLIFNVMTSTRHERLLLGCRRHSEWVSIELRYTGAGRREEALRMLSTPEHNEPLSELFGNQNMHSTHELSAMLGLQLRVKTQPGKGTLISISVPLSHSLIHPAAGPWGSQKRKAQGVSKALNGMLLIVEPDERLRELLSCALGTQGYQIATASNATDALACIAHSGVQPDLILTEYSLEQQMDGVQLIQKMRGQFNRVIPAIVLSADIHKQVSQLILAGSCTLLRKPVGLNMLLFTIGTLLRTAIQEQIELSINADRPPVVFLVNDDDILRKTLRTVLEANGYAVQVYCSCEEFFDSYSLEQQACLIVDAHMPGISGLELVERLRTEGDELPIIMISSNSRISTVVNAMKVGICDFIEKPFRRQDVLTSVAKALVMCKKTESSRVSRQSAIDHIAHLTVRQHQIMAMVLAGQPSKNIAANLGISQRTVEKHRASIMTRTEAKSIPELARLALAAGEQPR